MRCPNQCHEIGGPWISFDPDCPIHGYEAQKEAEDRENREIKACEEIQTLREKVAMLEARILKLERHNGFKGP